MTIPVRNIEGGICLEAWDKIMRIADYYRVTWHELSTRIKQTNKRFYTIIESKKMCYHMLMFQYKHTHRVLCEIFKTGPLDSFVIITLDLAKLEELTQ